jgi:hypothetical protein
METTVRPVSMDVDVSQKPKRDVKLFYLTTPVNLGNQYHNRSAAGLPCTDADLSCNMEGG